MKRVKLESVGAVRIAVLDTPAGHAPDDLARREILSLASDLRADEDAGALVLFCTGARQRSRSPETGRSGHEGLAEACAALEALEIPVIIGMQGAFESAGAEIALAAHFRLGAADTQLLWPDLHFGRFAGGGGIQRLTRIAGPAMALDHFGSGRPIPAETAEEAGVLDGVVQGDLIGACVRLATQLAEAGAGARRSSERSEGLASGEAFSQALAKFRETHAPAPDSAAARLAECVEAVLVLPGEAALAFELSLAKDLAGSEESRALEHIHRAERASAASETARGPQIRRIAVAEAGQAGAKLACELMLAGKEVILSETDPERLRAGLSQIGAGLSAAVVDGRLSPDDRNAALERLSSARSIPALSDCDLVIGGEVSADWSRHSALLADGVAAAAELPDRLAEQATFGLVQSPAGEGAVVEILPPAGAPEERIAALRDLLAAVGRRPVVNGAGCGAALLTRLSEALLCAAEQLLEEGARLRQFDRAFRDAGHAPAPLWLFDQAGLAAIRDRRRARSHHRDPRDRYVTILDRLVEAGRSGAAARQGFHDYPEGIPEGIASAEADALVETARREAAVIAHAITDEEIVQRSHLAFVLEALRCLDDGTARTAGDIDLVAVHGLGFPRAQGGPLYQAEQRGLDDLRLRLANLAETRDARFWTPPAYLDALISTGERLSA